MLPAIIIAFIIAFLFAFPGIYGIIRYSLRADTRENAGSFPRRPRAVPASRMSTETRAQLSVARHMKSLAFQGIFLSESSL